MKRLLLIGSAVLGLLVIVTAIAALQFNRFLTTPVNVDDEGFEFVIVPGTSFRSVSKQLADADVVSDALLFRLWARWQGKAGSIHAGEYLIKPGTTPAELLEQFASGDVRLYAFTIIEGWNRWELLAALARHEQVVTSLDEADWPALLAEFGAETSNPEGLFLPETYRFPHQTPDREILRQAYTLMQQVLAVEWQGRGEQLPLETPYEALVLASIIEKETAQGDERPRIAGVFTRRLQKRMRLQTDPTVIYGIGPGFDGNLTRRDLQTDTAYNTYTRSGLPPTPIAMPGRDSIRAALHPASGDELYFVATGRGDGRHTFSATKQEHDEAVADYLRRLRGGGQ